jgi:hypothetical protein
MMGSWNVHGAAMDTSKFDKVISSTLETKRDNEGMLDQKCKKSRIDSTWSNL